MDDKQSTSASEETRRTWEQVYPSRKRLTSVALVAAVTGALIVNVASTTAVNIALPTMAKDLQIPPDKVQWVVSAFSLSAGCLLLVCGRLADLYGRRTVFILGCTWNTIFFLASGFPQSMDLLIVLRALNGIGPAATVPAGLGILAQSFPPSKERSIAFSVFAAGAPLGAAIGQLFSGPIVQYTTAGWRAMFWSVAGMSALVGLLGWLAIDPDPKRPYGDTRVDWIGAILVTSGLVLITFALAEGNSARPSGWTSPYIIACLIVGPLLILAFHLWEQHLQNNTSFPLLIPLQIWTRAHGRVAAMLAVNTTMSGCFIAFGFWATLYYQDYALLSPTQTMLRLMPMPFSGFIALFICALLVGNASGALLLIIGEVATGFGSLLMAIIVPSAPFWQYGFPAAVLIVLGVDAVFAIGTLYIAKVSHPSEQSVAGALFQTVQQLGGALGLAVTTMAQTYATRKEAERLVASGASSSVALDRSMLDGFRVAQWTAVGFAGLALLITALFLRDIGIVGDKKKKSIEDIDLRPIEARPEDIKRPVK